VKRVLEVSGTGSGGGSEGPKLGLNLSNHGVSYYHY